MSDKKRIAKNSVYLYARMLVNMFVSLYTSRVILESLGIEDYGIFTVVGGIAVIFMFFSNALNGSTVRFITVSIGKDSLEESRRVFSMSINCHIAIALLILILSECIGLWLLNSELKIPADRMGEAQWVFQFGLLSCILGIITVPYGGCISAYEKFSFSAITTIIGSLLRLIICWVIRISPEGERLVFYAFLLLIIAIVMNIVNVIYCYRKFNICRYVKSRSKQLFKEMMSFTGWNIFKMGAIMGVSQGNNIIINVFAGPVANAAMAIANQVNGTIYNFTTTVQGAFSPQITKTIARRDYKENIGLTNLAAKLSFMMLCFFGVPIILQMSPILHIWLKEVPEATATLCVFSIISIAFDALTGPLSTIVFAIGHIKWYQIVTSVLWALAIPAAYFMLKFGIDFKYILISKIIAQLATLFYSLWYVNREIGLPIADFLINQCFRPLLISGFVCVCLISVTNVFSNQLINILFTAILSSVLLISGFYWFALDKSEKNTVKNLIFTKFLKRAKNTR